MWLATVVAAGEDQLFGHKDSFRMVPGSVGYHMRRTGRLSQL